jgi:hormone-sensitive lipase
LNDVWQTYYFLVTHAKEYFKINPTKIILVGDSAGGNLVAAVTIMAIQRGFRVPDGIILAYPALNLSRLNFMPSLLLSFDDPILPYPFLKMCLESYIGEKSDPNNNPYLSPLVASDHVLKQFPKTRIMVATNDPIRDDSFRFTLKLA